MPASETLKRLDFRYNDTPRAQTRDGIEIYYESRGEGPALTILNNFFMVSPAWRIFTEELARRNRVVTYDLCNQGASTRVDDEPSWDDHIADALGVLDACGIEQTFLLGTSISAVLARDIAIAYPDRVLGLILVGPAIGPRGMRRHRRVMKSWLATLDGLGQKALYDHIYPLVFGSEMIETTGTPGYLGLRESFLTLHSTEEIRSSLAMSLAPNPNPVVMSDISAPTLVLCGDDDFLISPTSARDLAASVPDGRVEIMPHASHLPFIDDVAGFESAIQKFIDEVSERS